MKYATINDLMIAVKRVNAEMPTKTKSVGSIVRHRFMVHSM